MKKKFSKMILIVLIIILLELPVILNYAVYAEETNTTEETNVTTTEEAVEPEKKQINTLKIEINSTIYSYTEEQRKAWVKVYDSGKKLTENIDYTLTYKNNINPGRASVTIQGKGNYTGSVVKYFYIAPKKAYIKSVKFNSDYTKATIKWKKDNKATGYILYMSKSKNGKYSKIKTIKNKKTTSYTKKDLNPAKEYYFKIIAYKQYGDVKIQKKFSNPKTGNKLLASVTLTAHGSGSNRKFNLAKACNTVRGLVLEPGEVFNWFKVVGPASGSRGYKKASIFKAGKVSEGYGGGVCQVSSTIYQASRKAKLKIIERHIHSRPVTYTSLGNDATVSYGVQNLRIKNTKSYPIKFVTSASGESTTCKIYSLVD